MKRKIIGILVCMLMIGTTTLAVADWEPSDGHKMHFPQMPDPIGWDVNFHDFMLADDWKCSETGPVTDIHFWISWRGDLVGELPFINVAIYSNNPQGQGGYSEPLEPLWTRTFNPAQFIIKGPMIGDQGWFDPSQMLVIPHDHIQYYQINIKNIEAPFIQQLDTVYWLVIQMPFLYPIEVGWKTTLDKFMDTAVWGYQGMWTPVINPMSGPLDFAFVITGGYPKIPDLTCNGTLRWTKVKAGSTVTGNFTVGNIGTPGSLLDWEVSSWPTWGTWTFTPASGVGLPAGSSVTVGVSVVAPTTKNKQFTGSIEVRNKNNYADNCTIAVSLQTPRSRTTVEPIFFNLLQRFFSQFPVLHWILNPK
jgi:hypothetical protein